MRKICDYSTLRGAGVPNKPRIHILLCLFLIFWVLSSKEARAEQGFKHRRFSLRVVRVGTELSPARLLSLTDRAVSIFESNSRIRFPRINFRSEPDRGLGSISRIGRAYGRNRRVYASNNPRVVTIAFVSSSHENIFGVASLCSRNRHFALVMVNERLTDSQLLFLFLHELGHVFGAAHRVRLVGAQNLMYPYWDAFFEQPHKFKFYEKTISDFKRCRRERVQICRGET